MFWPFISWRDRHFRLVEVFSCIMKNLSSTEIMTHCLLRFDFGILSVLLFVHNSLFWHLTCSSVRYIVSITPNDLTIAFRPFFHYLFCQIRAANKHIIINFIYSSTNPSQHVVRFHRLVIWSRKYIHTNWLFDLENIFIQAGYLALRCQDVVLNMA
jgi:membrane-associated phospholipid phosphatase